MRTVFVTYHHEGDTWWAEAPTGFSATAQTLAETRQLVLEGLTFAYHGEDFCLVEDCHDQADGASLAPAAELGHRG